MVMEAPANVTAVDRYQFDGAVGGDIDEGYHPAFHDRSHGIAYPCLCPYPCLPNRVVNATVTVVATSSDLELALNRGAESPNEPACVRKAMGTEREVAEGGDCGNVDHDRSSAVEIGHWMWNLVWCTRVRLCLGPRGHEESPGSGSSWLAQEALGQNDRCDDDDPRFA